MIVREVQAVMPPHPAHVYDMATGDVLPITGYGHLPQTEPMRYMSVPANDGRALGLDPDENAATRALTTTTAYLQIDGSIVFPPT